MKKLCLILLSMIVAISACKKSDLIDVDRIIYDDSILDSLIKLGKIYYHHQPAGQAMDVYMADIYVKLRGDTPSLTLNETTLSLKRESMKIKPGINKMSMP